MSWRGYGLTYRNRKRVSAHREAFRQAYGYLPEVVMHKCDNPLCVNPEHLAPGTQSLNMKDCVAKGRWKGQQNLLNGAKVKVRELTAARIRICYGVLSTRRLGRLFGLAESTIRRYGLVGRA